MPFSVIMQLTNPILFESNSHSHKRYTLWSQTKMITFFLKKKDDLLPALKLE